eukprot:TRINITY_DN3868_c0_g1_i10.p1 TRINITY_DN3868_c0_g1~~TRINITY_DN3868_c0_g1_i10.p1  ORF type:complete len:276 (+),score=27.90 TRINITY_DN3868_c0_g1_i10:52-879(+)
MDSKGSTSSRMLTPVLLQSGKRSRSTCAPKRVRFSTDDIKMREFEVMKLRPLSDASSFRLGDMDAHREYRMAISVRRRHAQDKSHAVNEERGLWRANRLSKKLETDDESHLGIRQEWLEHFREVIERAEARAASEAPEATGRSDDRRPVPVEADRRHEDAEILFLEAVRGQSLNCPVDGIEPAHASSADGASTSDNAKKKTFGRTLKSLTTGFVRASGFTTKSLSYARSKMCFRGTRSENASHATTSRGNFFRWPTRNRSRVHASFDSVVPDHDA